MEVVPDGVVDEPLLRLRLAAGLQQIKSPLEFNEPPSEIVLKTTENPWRAAALWSTKPVTEASLSDAKAEL